jgi:hypothetical protein
VNRQCCLTLSGLALGLAGCAATPAADAIPVKISTEEATDVGLQTPCEGQDEDFGCYAVPEAVPENGGLVVEATGPSAENYPLGTVFKGTDRIILKAGDAVSILTRDGLRKLVGPGTYTMQRTASHTNYAYLTSPRRRARTGAVRGGGGAEPGPQFLVIRGDPIALGWYRAGRSLPVASRICLPPNAKFLTLQRTDGGLVTYGGGGCNRAIEEPKPGEGETGAGRGV